jgi:hypothetical protein
MCAETEVVVLQLLNILSSVSFTFQSVPAHCDQTKWGLLIFPAGGVLEENMGHLHNFLNSA